MRFKLYCSDKCGQQLCSFIGTLLPRAEHLWARNEPPKHSHRRRAAQNGRAIVLYQGGSRTGTLSLLLAATDESLAAAVCL